MNSYHHDSKNNTSSSVTGRRFKVFNRSFGVCMLALGLAACGGSSDSNDGGGGANSPVFGQPGANACLYSNTSQVDLACYLVPGEPGETPELIYAAYTSGSGKLGFTDTYSWHDITASSAQYDLNGETTHFDWDDTSGYNGNGSITQTDDKNGPEEDKLTRPLKPFIDAKETVINIGDDGVTRTGELMVFEPKTRTISVPGASDVITAHNAIMLVQTVELFPAGAGLVSIEYYVPEEGPVAQTVYVGCPDTSSLSFVDDAAYYEQKCESATTIGRSTMLEVQ